MLGWIIGIIGFIIVLLIILKLTNKKEPVRYGSLAEETSGFQKFLDKCCRHK